MQTDRVVDGASSRRTAWPVPLALLLASGTATALAVLASPWGSLFFLDDTFGAASVVVPLAAGALVGVLQTAAFGPRLTLGALAVVTVFGLGSLVLVFPAAMHLLGVAVGTSIVTSVRGGVLPRRAAVVLLLAVTAVAGSYAAVEATGLDLLMT